MSALEDAQAGIREALLRAHDDAVRLAFEAGKIEGANGGPLKEHPAIALLREMSRVCCPICDCEGAIGHDDGCRIGEILAASEGP